MTLPWAIRSSDSAPGSMCFPDRRSWASTWLATDEDGTKVHGCLLLAEHRPLAPYWPGAPGRTCPGRDARRLLLPACQTPGEGDCSGPTVQGVELEAEARGPRAWHGWGLDPAWANPCQRPPAWLQSQGHTAAASRRSGPVASAATAAQQGGVQPGRDVPYFVGNTSSSVTSFCTELITKSTYWGAVHLTFFPRSSYQ